MPSWYGGITYTEYNALITRLTRIETKIDKLQHGVDALKAFLADMDHQASKVSIRLGKPTDKPSNQETKDGRNKHHD